MRPNRSRGQTGMDSGGSASSSGLEPGTRAAAGEQAVDVRLGLTAMLACIMSGNFQVGVILDRPLTPKPAHVAELESRFDAVLVPDPGSSVVFFIQARAKSISRAVDHVVDAVEEVMDAQVIAIYASAGAGVPGQA